MKKFYVKKEETESAVRVNGKEPLNVLGMSRGTLFRSLSKNGVTMTDTDIGTDTEPNIGTDTEVPVPQWSPEVTKEAN